ncbi:MAG TPA: nicotinamide riboside transporter PnuC [Gemmatimonas sp.]|nr:nicotinamide riboside transporter PnuC [Gemmatimonas sp.]
MTDVGAWLLAHGSSWTELSGFVSGVVCVYLVTRESVWNWPLAIVTSGFYIAVFAREGLYSDTGLQCVYLVLSVYGWWHWIRGSRANPGTTSELASSTLAVSRTPPHERVLLAMAGVALWLLLWAITRDIPGARSPLLDAALTATSLVAQYMMTRKYLGNWTIWIIADIAYVGLFAARGLRLTALLYAVYLALAVLGHVQWKRSLARAPHASS